MPQWPGNVAKIRHTAHLAKLFFVPSLFHAAASGSCGTQMPEADASESVQGRTDSFYEEWT